MRKAAVIFVILCLIAGLGAGAVLYKKYAPTKARADQGAIYGAEGSQVALVLDYELQEQQGIYENGQSYLPLGWVNEHLNERFYWDDGEKLLVYALPESIVYADASTMGTSGTPLLLDREDGVYLSLGLVANYTDIRVSAFDGGDVKRVYIQSSWEPVETADIGRNGKVRQKGGVKSPIVTDVFKDDEVVVLDTMESWSKVATPDGHMGYIQNRFLKNIRAEQPVSDFEAPVYTNISLDEKIVLVWHQVTTQAANKGMEALIAATEGVNVISPTWYALTDNEGGYQSLADKAYVDRAHEMGLQVWALVDNFSDNVQTEVLLSSTATRNGLIEDLMAEADRYGFDGINLDFEGIREEAGVHYVQFIRELSVACREKGLVLSVDNYVPAAYNSFYNRREQGIVADYVIIMGYDEHYAGGEPGSVASIGYVNQGIADTLADVPKEKLINAVPFYTRLWTEKDGSCTSRAMGLEAAGEWIEENNVKMTWQEELGQYYGECENEEGMNYLWLEDVRSLELKMNLIRDYELAGVAGWKLGLETGEVWDVLNWKLRPGDTKEP